MERPFGLACVFAISGGTNEFSLSVERQLGPTFAVRATGVYSRDFNTLRVLNTLRPYSVYSIPITNPDPGPDGRLGTSDDPGTVVTYYDYPSSLRGAAFQRPMYINDAASDAHYQSFELALTRRERAGRPRGERQRRARDADHRRARLRQLDLRTRTRAAEARGQRAGVREVRHGGGGRRRPSEHGTAGHGDRSTTLQHTTSG